MQLSRKALDAYNAAIKQQGDSAEGAARKALGAWLSENPGASIAEAREFCIALMQEVGTVYGNAAGDAAYALRGIAAEAAGAELPDVDYAYEPEREHVAKAARYQVGKLKEGDTAGFVDAIADASRYFAERGANDTMANLGKEDAKKLGKKVRFARVPTGATTCPYCCMLASRGFVYKSGLDALNANHRHCDCRIVEGFEGMTIEGYDPDLYYDMWKNPERYAEGGPQISGAADRPPNEQSILTQYNMKQGDVSDDLAAVNPHYSEGFEWQNNCQRCVVAYELRLRGYDVTAKPFANDRIGDSGTACWVYDRNAWFLDSQFVDTRRTTFKSDIESAFDQWGDGARGIIRVKWNRGEGHFFSVRREGGVLIYEDPQNGTVRDIDQTLSMCTRARNELWFMRVDGRELTDLVEEAVENVGS